MSKKYKKTWSERFEGNHIFTFCSHKNRYWCGDEFFYLVNKTELLEWLVCKIKENR